MGVLVTVQFSGSSVRLRRYARASGPIKHQPICTHDGAYDPDSVDQTGVSTYVHAGAPQDRVSAYRA